MSIPTAAKTATIPMKRSGTVEARRAGRTQVRVLMESAGGTVDSVSSAMKFNEMVVAWGVVSGSIQDEYGSQVDVARAVRPEYRHLGPIAQPDVYDAMAPEDIASVIKFVLGGTLTEIQVGNSEPPPA